MNTAKFTIYHPNGKGTGAALQLELHPATDSRDGYIDMAIAPQEAIGSAVDHTYPTFNWNKERVFRINLTFDMVCRMLQVMRGEYESINDGKGIFVKRNGAEIVFKFSHYVEPWYGYTITINEETHNGDATFWCRNISFNLSSSEALGLACAMEQSLGVLCFGVPCVFEH